jgi:integrase
VPWICAYTGACVNEITQLRKMDVRKRSYEGEDVWTIHITPDAGRVKNNRAREVPLHEHLVAQGFPEFVAGCAKERLFFDPDRRRGGSDENPTSAKVGQKIAEWVRKIGIPEGLAPNHGWRHRFNAVSRRKRIVPEIRDAIKGHVPRTEGEEYGGDVEWDMMWPEVKLLPRIEVDPATGPIAHTDARAKATKARADQRKRARAREKAAKAKATAMAAE